MQNVRDGDTELPDFEEVSSTVVEVRELRGKSRCVPCQEAARECHVKRYRQTCLQCQSSDFCQFRRTVVSIRRCADWTWRELVGETDHTPEQKRSYAVPDTVPRKRPWEQSTELQPRESFVPPPPPPPSLDPPQQHQQQRLQGDLAPLAPGMTGQSRYSSLPPIRHHSVHELPKSNEDLRPRLSRNSDSGYSTLPPARKYDVTPSLPTSSPVSPVRAEMSCPQCNIQFTTKSERMKHMSRHERTFVCNVSGCTRSQGFTTQNDLDRHKRTVHRVSGGRYWKCFYPDCPKAAKLWPRLDNFRAHIIRMHGNNHADEYVRRADEWWEEDQMQQGQFTQSAGSSRPVETSMLPKVIEAFIRPQEGLFVQSRPSDIFFDHKETKDSVGPTCLNKIKWFKSQTRPVHGDIIDVELVRREAESIPLRVFVDEYCPYDILLGAYSMSKLESTWLKRSDVPVEDSFGSGNQSVKHEESERQSETALESSQQSPVSKEKQDLVADKAEIS